MGRFNHYDWRSGCRGNYYSPAGLFFYTDSSGTCCLFIYIFTPYVRHDPQEHCAQSPRLGLFGQVLAALYQGDIVDEDDIRAWHALPESKGHDADNLRRCWTVGSRMIEQFDEQDDESSESE